MPKAVEQNHEGCRCQFCEGLPMQIEAALAKAQEGVSR
jgi:hypothetical protein